MFFDSSLFFVFLFVAMALTDNPRERRSGFLNRVERSSNAASNEVQYTKNWSGAVWEKEEGTFTHVTGTFNIPVISGGKNVGASAWVGIDGHTCTSALIRTGVTFAITDKGVSYDAWYQWHPDRPYPFPDHLAIVPGDIVKASIRVLASTSGEVTIENKSTGQAAVVTLSSIDPLCGQNAEWVVEDFPDDQDQLVPFANFGAVTFWGAEATGKGTYTSQGAILLDIEQNDQVLTSAWISGSSVGVTYV